MDFSELLSTGELSDVVVIVDEKEFKLHKFPLFIKSDYFRDLARSVTDRIELSDFPGGVLLQCTGQSFSGQRC